MKVKLGELVSIRTGKLDANAANENGKYPFFTCSRDNLFINKYSYDCECVLVAGNGDLNVKYYNGKFDAYQRTYIIESKNNELYVPYLFWFMQQYVETLRRQSIGGVIKYIKLENLTEVKFNLFSFNEQKKLVYKLEKVQNIISLYQSQLKRLDTLIKSRFVEMFGDIKNNDRSFEVKRLEEVCNGIGDGLHGTPEYINNDTKYPFINGNNLQDGRIIINSSTKYVSKETYEKNLIEMNGNTILISINGTLGKIAFYNNETLMLGKSACYCNLKKDINKVFVYYLMKSDRFLEYMEENATASTIKNVGLKAMRDYRIILPSIELQNNFASFVAQVDKSKFVEKTC